MTDPAYAAKLRSLSFSRHGARRAKATTDRDGDVAITTTEHWDDHVDVVVRPRTHLTKGPAHG